MTTIAFLEPTLSLVHIPPDVFPHFLHATLTLLHACPAFFSLSITPSSVSVILPEALAKDTFLPCAERLAGHDHGGVTIETAGYLAMQIDGEGIGDGDRLVQLTAPLARAGVSILFITTYFSDYILVARTDERKVRRALLDADFVFEDLSGSFVSRRASPVQSQNLSDGEDFGGSLRRESTSELASFEFDEEALFHGHDVQRQQHGEEEGRVIKFLRDSGVPVSIYTRDKLVMTGLRAEVSDVLPALTRILLQHELPRFFSLTAAPDTPASMLLPIELLQGPPSLLDTSLLMGFEHADQLVALSLDLRRLPDDCGCGQTALYIATNGHGKSNGKLHTEHASLGGCGIVCGVVEELIRRSPGNVELVMSYLSTVVSGNVLIREQDVRQLGSDDACKVM
ncbi:hypothetical protein PYCC9005_001494 [Savitreella phatthalungensis]